jgi:hypothetical protein
MAQGFPVTSRPQHAQDTVAGLCDGVKVGPGGAVAGDGLQLFGVTLEERQARPKEGDDIDRNCCERTT